MRILENRFTKTRIEDREILLLREKDPREKPSGKPRSSGKNEKGPGGRTFW